MGHTRLSTDDFLNYIEEIRPDEKEMASSFYMEGLNRMTIADCAEQVKKAGLEIISLLPIVREPHLQMITDEILRQTVWLYPTATMLDLASSKVLLITRKS